MLSSLWVDFLLCMQLITPKHLNKYKFKVLCLSNVTVCGNKSVTNFTLIKTVEMKCVNRALLNLTWKMSQSQIVLNAAPGILLN